MIVAKSLPHSISYSNLTDGNTRKVVMELNENVTSLHSQLKEVQVVCKNGVGSGKSVNVETLATEVAPLVASTVIAKTAEATAAAATATQKAEAASGSASAAGESETNAAASETAANEYAYGKTVEGVVTVDGALQYKNAAISSAQAAALSETNAGTSETNAANSATAADEYANGKYVSGELTVNGAKQYKEAAEAARDRAEAAAATAAHIITLPIVGVAVGNAASDTATSNGIIHMATVVPDSSKSYSVTVNYVMNIKLASNTRYFVLLTYDGDGTLLSTDSESITASSINPIEKGSVVKTYTRTVPGDGKIVIVNGGTSATSGYANCSVFVKVSEASS